MISRKDIRQGMVVMSRDGAVIGQVLDANEDGLLIRAEEGFTHPLLAYDDVGAVDGDEIRLLLAREELRKSDTTEAIDAVVARAGTSSEELRGGLHLSPRELEEARMDSAKFQHHAAPGTGDHPHEVAGGPATGEPRGGLGLSPRDLEQARMDSAKFQDHGQYDLRAGGEAATETRRLSDEEDTVPRTSIPETDPNARIAATAEEVTPRRMAYEEEDEVPRTSIPETDPNARIAGPDDTTFAPKRRT